MTWFDRPARPWPGRGWPTCPNCSSPPNRRPRPRSPAGARDKPAAGSRIRRRRPLDPGDFEFQLEDSAAAPSSSVGPGGHPPSDRLARARSPNRLMSRSPSSTTNRPSRNTRPPARKPHSLRLQADGLGRRRRRRRPGRRRRRFRRATARLSSRSKPMASRSSTTKPDLAPAVGFEVVENRDSSSFALPVSISGTLPVVGSAGPLGRPRGTRRSARSRKSFRSRGAGR